MGQHYHLHGQANVCSYKDNLLRFLISVMISTETIDSINPIADMQTFTEPPSTATRAASSKNTSMTAESVHHEVAESVHHEVASNNYNVTYLLIVHHSHSTAVEHSLISLQTAS